ncbi:hypothetical protein [Vibrio phage vB_pir03]|nr:hypothetical protein [Vibrio phage vB_pir03]
MSVIRNTETKVLLGNTVRKGYFNNDSGKTQAHLMKTEPLVMRIAEAIKKLGWLEGTHEHKYSEIKEWINLNYSHITCTKDVRVNCWIMRFNLVPSRLDHLIVLNKADSYAFRRTTTRSKEGLYRQDRNSDVFNVQPSAIFPKRIVTTNHDEGYERCVLMLRKWYKCKMIEAPCHHNRMVFENLARLIKNLVNARMPIRAETAEWRYIPK